MFNELTTALSNNAGSARLNSLLYEWAHQQEPGTRGMQEAGINTRSREINAPLQKVSAGPWMSVGGYFDYSNWADRERFMELDKAIARAESEIPTQLSWNARLSRANTSGYVVAQPAQPCDLGAREAAEEPEHGAR